MIMRILFLNKAPKNAAKYNVESIEKLLNSYASPGTKIEIGFPDNFAGSQVEDALGNQSMLNGLDHMMDVPSLIRKIIWAEANGYDAVIQSTFDPGVDGGRLVVKIPVIGPMRTTIHAAATLADKIGITVPLRSHIPYTWRLLRMIGMDHMVADIRTIHIYGADLDQRRDEITEKSIALIKDMVKDTGVEAIIPLGGAIIPYVVDPADLQAGAGVPVFNTKAVSIRFAEACVACGMTQSPHTYPRADLKPEDFITEV
jgi:allantoin racemase